MKRILSLISALFVLATTTAQVQYGGVIKAPNNAGTVATVARNSDALKVWDSTVVSKLDSSKLSKSLILVGNWPSSQVVTGTFWQATQPVSLSSLPALATGANTIGNVNVNGTVPVSGTFWQSTQPVSIAATVTTSDSKLPSALGQAAATSSLPVVVANEQVQDGYITGAAAQSALNVNAILAVSGSGSFDAIPSVGVSYRSASITIVASAGISAGQVTLEGSNDNFASTAQNIVAYNETQSASAFLTGAQTIAASSVQTWTFRCTWRYIRLRISTAFVGGSIQCFSKFSTVDLPPRVVGAVMTNNGTNVAVKQASTAAVAADAALVVAVSPNNTVVTQAADNSATISIAANATPSGQITTGTGAGTVEVLLTGTFTATLQIQVSTDAGTTWSNVTGGSQIMNKLTGAYMASGNLTATGTYVMSVAGSVGVRVITTAYTSGTVTGTVRATQAQAMVGITGTPTVTVNTVSTVTTLSQFAPSTAAADGTTNPTTTIERAADHLFNGTTWDRYYNNTEVTLLASAARTTTQTSADIINYNWKKLTVVLDMTAVGTGSVTVSINGKDAASGKYYNILTGTAITTNSTNRYRVGETLAAVANSIAQDYLPRIIQIVVTANNANTATYSVGYNFGL